MWIPVALGLGIAFYYALGVEPGLMASLSLYALFLLLAVFWQFRVEGAALSSEIKQILCLGVAAGLLMSTGFMAAKIRTERVAAPVLAKKTGPVEVMGVVVALAHQPAGGWKAIVAPESIGGLTQDALPLRIRLTIRQKQGDLRPGQRVRLRAVINPPPGPVAPGAFDFARQAWFRQIGGYGYTIARPEVLEPLARAPLIDRMKRRLARVRMAMAERIRTDLPGAGGAVAAALLTGDRDAIPPDVVENLRIAGLAHLLAISGLHMALVAGVFFAMIYFVLAAIEPLALRYPIRKWAAVAGLLGGGVYLVLSGGSISTQRAYIMLSLMFLAVLLDRPVVSMRTVALAATIILLTTPESLLSVSFQMSFSAVVALISFYEWRSVSRTKKMYQREILSWYAYWPQKFWLYGVGLAMTSLIAGLASAPFAAYHFNRVAAFGLAANLAAMPLMAGVIMPAAVLVFILMPLGLERYALEPMGWGIDRVLAIAQHVSSWQSAELLLPSWPQSALALMVMGGLWLCLWQRPWRLAGGGAIAAGLMLAVTYQPPDILIDRDGALVAVRDSRHALHVLPSRKAYFTAVTWLRREGQKSRMTGSDGKAAAFFSCDSLACVTPEDAPVRVSYVLDPRAFEEDCQRADIIVSSLWLPWRLSRRCHGHALVIDRTALERNGAYAIWIGDHGLRIRNTASVRGVRPWSVRQKTTHPPPGKRKHIYRTARR